MTAAAVQIAINLKMPKMSHPMNHLDCWSNLLTGKQVQTWGLLSRAAGDLLVTTDYVEIDESKGIHFLRK